MAQRTVGGSVIRLIEISSNNHVVSESKEYGSYIKIPLQLNQPKTLGILHLMKAFVYQRGKTALTSLNYSDFSFCKDMFEKYGGLRQFRSGEYFVHSGDVMEYVGWLVSGGFKYSLTASDGIDKTIGFALADSDKEAALCIDFL